MAVIVPAVIGAVIGGANLYMGEKRKKDAKKAGMNRPTYTAPQENKENVALAEYLAQQGLSDTAKQTYLNGINGSMSQAISGILKGGGDVNTIGNLYATAEGGINKLAIADDEARLRNIKLLMGARSVLADDSDKSFQINQYAPFVDSKKAEAAAMASGSQQSMAGVSQIGSSVAGAVSGMSQKKDITNVFGNAPSPAPNKLGDTPSPVPGGGNGTQLGKTYNPSTNSYYDTIDFSKMNQDQKNVLYYLYNPNGSNYNPQF